MTERLPAGAEIRCPCCGAFLQRQWVWMAFEFPSCGFYLTDDVLADAGMTNLQIRTRQCICESSMDVIEGAMLTFEVQHARIVRVSVRAAFPVRYRCDVCTQVEQQFGPIVGIEKGSPFDFPVLCALPDADAPAP